MKKFAMALSIFMIVVLCSCGGGSKRELVRDNPAQDIKTALNLSEVENGVSLDSDLDRTKAFSDVKVASDLKSSVFYQTIDLDEYLTHRLKQVDIKVLYFNGKIPSVDISNFLKVMNDKEYGLTEEKLGVIFNKTEKTSDSLFGKLSLKYSLSLPKDYVLKENDTTKLVVAYLPTYCVYNDGKEDYTKVFVFVPIYYAFTYSSSVDSYTQNMKNYQITLTEEGLLPSQTA